MMWRAAQPGVTRSLPRRTLCTAVCVAEPRPAEHAHAAVEALKATAHHLSVLQLARNIEQPPAYDSLIYDLAPWDDSAVDLIHALRRHHRTLPVLLYLPSRGPVSSLVDRCKKLDGIRIKFQSTRGLGELVHHVRWLHGAIHAERLTYLLDLLLPTMSDCTHRYVRHVLNRLAGGHRMRPLTVGGLVSELGIPLYRLRRELMQGGFPSPKVLLDWITLLLASLNAQDTGRTTVAVARDFGVDTTRMYQIRRRLLMTSNIELPVSARQEFDLAFLAFAESCRVPSREASTLLHRTA